jgi:hypothetical protein
MEGAITARSTPHDMASELVEAVRALEGDGALGPGAAAYARALQALAEALAGADDGARGAADALHRWVEPATADGALADAAGDVFGDPAGLGRLLRRAAERIDGATRPNLRSMLRAKVIWRARDLERARRARAGREAPMSAAPQAGRDPQARFVAALVVDRVVARFGDDPQLGPVLAALLGGSTVAEAARKAGISRPAVYRRLAQVRAWVEGAP